LAFSGPFWGVLGGCEQSFTKGFFLINSIKFTEICVFFAKTGLKNAQNGPKRKLKSLRDFLYVSPYIASQNGLPDSNIIGPLGSGWFQSVSDRFSDYPDF